MIVVRLKGGLGNQMFQYSFAKILSQQLKKKILIDVSYLKKSKLVNGITPRDFELNSFGLETNKMPLVLRFIFSSNKFLNFIFKLFLKIKIITDQSIPTISQMVNCDIIILDGYFQKYSQLDIYRNELLKVFEFALEPSKENLKALENIKSKVNSVSIHVRRGDYLSANSKNVHFVCDSEYYQAAISKIKETINNPCFFIFSADDPDWPKNNLIINDEHYFVGELNTGLLGFENMRLMSNCKHNIIANSSFSWWAAWLNPNLDKIVIAPDQWTLKDDENHWADKILPKDWIRIKAN